MMSTKVRSFSPLPYDLSLEDLVPDEHFYRRLEAQLDLSFVREMVAPLYAGVPARGQRLRASHRGSGLGASFGVHNGSPEGGRQAVEAPQRAEARHVEAREHSAHVDPSPSSWPTGAD